MTDQPLTAQDVLIAARNARIGTDLVSDAGGKRVWHLHLRPGETLPAHRHDRPYYWTALTDGAGRSRYGDGRVQDVIYRAGETRSFMDLGLDATFVHDLTNTGYTDLMFVTVEFDRCTTARLGSDPRV